MFIHTIHQKSIINHLSEASTLVDILLWRSYDQPDKRAYTFLQDGETESGSLTYRELDLKARKIATYLQSLGATQERALLLYPPGLEFIVAFFGCLYAGVIAVPLYPPKRNQKLSRLQAVIADAGAKFALTTQSILENVEIHFSETPDLAALNWLATEQKIESDPEQWQQLDIKKDSLAFLQYTSGSTGTPKGVMVSHGNLLNNSEYIKQAFELNQDSVSISWLPSFHDMGLIDGVIQPIYTGFLGVLMPSVAFLQKPIRWLEGISHYRATHSGGPNFAYDLCVQKITPEQKENLDLSSWLSAYSGAEPVRQDTIKRFTESFKCCGFQEKFFYPCYGMAETTLMISGGLLGNEPSYCSVQVELLQKHLVTEIATGEKTNQKVQHFVSCGQSWLDTKIIIANPETLTECREEQVGEIWVSGSSVAQGYWNRPQQTQETFQAYLATGAGPFLRTGDLGFLKDRELFITGRLKDVIIIRGRNHYPQDIELTVERSHEALKPNSGAAFTVEVEGEERLVIVQEVERSYLRKLDVDEVIEAIRRDISQEHELQVYAIALIKTMSIPKTSSGKIQRHSCKLQFLNNTLSIVSSNIFAYKQTVEESEQEDLPELETILKEKVSLGEIRNLIASILQIKESQIFLNRPLNRLGIDSIQAAEIKYQIEVKYGLVISMESFLDDINLIELITNCSKSTELSTTESTKDKNNETQEILNNLNLLSEQEIDELLKRMS